MEGMNDATWRKSTFSGGNGGGCVEVGSNDNTVMVRDTKLPNTSPVLRFAPQTWREFATRIRNAG